MKALKLERKRENQLKKEEMLKEINLMNLPKLPVQKGKQILKELQDAIADSRYVVKKTMELSFANRNKEAIEYFTREIPKRSDRTDKALDAVVSFQYENTTTRIKEIRDKINMEILIFSIFTSISTALAIFFAFLISRSVKKPVTELQTSLERVAQGDLSVEIKVESKDELGMISQSVREVITSIKKLILESKTISSSLASSSEELSATKGEISRNLKSQTERANQIASAAEQMSQTVVDIAKNASNIAELSVTSTNVDREDRDMTLIQHRK